MRALYDSKSKTIDDRGIKALFSDEEKYKTWLLFESALAQAQAEEGFIPESAARDIKTAAKVENIDFEEMDRIYRKIGHGFVPFLKVLVKACPRKREIRPLRHHNTKYPTKLSIVHGQTSS